jgi:UDP-N-acetylmuramyl pentapeptide synthase
MVGGGPWTGPTAQSGVSPVVIEVTDTLEALQRVAAAVRRSVSTRVVAITGSAGKTTTKETIAALLGGSFRVVKNEGNLNNHIGLPLSLLRLRDEPDVAVMELGMNHRGEISALVAIADPDVRVWTNVGDAHLGFFTSSDAIADAKAEILEGAEPRDLLVCNADDPRVMARAGAFVGRTSTFGLSASRGSARVSRPQPGVARSGRPSSVEAISRTRSQARPSPWTSGSNSTPSWRGLVGSGPRIVEVWCTGFAAVSC